MIKNSLEERGGLGMNFKSIHMKIVLLAFIIVVMFISLASDCSRSDTFNLSIGITGDGTVTPAEGNHRIERGATVDLTVKAAEGWEFDRWTGPNANDVIEDGETYKINMNSNKSIRANFINGETEEVGKFLTLTKGGHVKGVDGVTIGDPANILTEDINLLLEKTGDPSKDVPFPDYIKKNNIVSDFYELSAEEFFTTDKNDDYLIMGIPVPDNVDPGNLGFVVLTPPGWIISLEAMDSSINWEFIEGDYEEDTGIFWTLLPTLSTTDSPQIIALVQAEWLFLPEAETLSGLYGSDNFRIFRKGLSESESPPAHKEKTYTQLETALDSFLNFGFEEPRLRKTRRKIDSNGYGLTRRYSYSHREGEIPNGYYNGFLRTAGTIYPGSPTLPNKITATHELFHAVKYAYSDIYWQTVWANMPGATIEGTATAVEQSLNGLTRSDRSISMYSRRPIAISTSLFDHIPFIDWENWWSPTIESAITSDYQTQDFWVYIGKKMNPNNPQIDFLIDLFDSYGGTKEDIDEWLANNHNFSGLSDAYWQWAKDYSFEKTIKLGTYDDEVVPANAPGEWWNRGLGYKWDNTGRFLPNTGGFTGEPVNFILEPLSSRAFVIELEPGTNFYEVTLDVDTGNNNMIKYKFYDGTNENWLEDRDNTARTFIVESNRVEVYVLVSNTALESGSGNLRVTVNMVEYAPYEVSGRVTDYTGEGVAGVAINFSGDLSYQSVSTDSNGYWSQELYAEITITPNFDEDYTFEPESKTLTVDQAKSDVNFTAHHWYNVSGNLSSIWGEPLSSSVYFYREGADEYFDYIWSGSGGWSKDLTGKVIISPYNNLVTDKEITGRDSISPLDWIPSFIIVEKAETDLLFMKYTGAPLPEFDIGGVVYDINGFGIGNVLIRIEFYGDPMVELVTDINGLWLSQGNFYPGDHITIIPEHSDFIFEPEMRETYIGIEPGNNFSEFVGHPK